MKVGLQTALHVPQPRDRQDRRDPEVNSRKLDVTMFHNESCAFAASLRLNLEDGPRQPKVSQDGQVEPKGPGKRTEGAKGTPKDS